MVPNVNITYPLTRYHGEAIERGDFYAMCPDGETTPEMDRKRVLWHAQDLTENRPPLSRWHPDFKELWKLRQ